MPAAIARPTIDAGTAARIVDALAHAARPVLYVGGGVLSARATEELTALAEQINVPVAHTLMGKGCLREDHPLLLGQTGFWGTPLANDTCRAADPHRRGRYAGWRRPTRARGTRDLRFRSRPRVSFTSMRTQLKSAATSRRNSAWWPTRNQLSPCSQRRLAA